MAESRLAPSQWETSLQNNAVSHCRGARISPASVMEMRLGIIYWKLIRPMITIDVSPNVASPLNTLRPRQNGRHFPDDISKYIFLNENVIAMRLGIFLNENVWILIASSLNFLTVPADNKPALVQLTHWGREKMDAISQTTLSNAFSWMKMHEFRLRFHWSLFLKFELTIFQHWFR